MAPQFRRGFETPAIRAEKTRSQPGVTQKQLGRLGQSFADVGKPGRKPLNQKRAFQQGEVPLKAGLGDRQAAGQVGIIKELTSATGQEPE